MSMSRRSLIWHCCHFCQYAIEATTSHALTCLIVKVVVHPLLFDEVMRLASTRNLEQVLRGHSEWICVSNQGPIACVGVAREMRMTPAEVTGESLLTEGPIDGGSDRPIIEKGPIDRGSNRPIIETGPIDRGTDRPIIGKGPIDRGSDRPIIEKGPMDRGSYVDRMSDRSNFYAS